MKITDKELALMITDLDLLNQDLSSGEDSYKRRTKLIVKLSKELDRRGKETMISKVYLKEPITNMEDS